MFINFAFLSHLHGVEIKTRLFCNSRLVWVFIVSNSRQLMSKRHRPAAARMIMTVHRSAAAAGSSRQWRGVSQWENLSIRRVSQRLPAVRYSNGVSGASVRRLQRLQLVSFSVSARLPVVCCVALSCLAGVHRSILGEQRSAAAQPRLRLKAKTQFLASGLRVALLSWILYEFVTKVMGVCDT